MLKLFTFTKMLHRTATTTIGKKHNKTEEAYGMTQVKRQKNIHVRQKTAHKDWSILKAK